MAHIIGTVGQVGIFRCLVSALMQSVQSASFKNSLFVLQQQICFWILAKLIFFSSIPCFLEQCYKRGRYKVITFWRLVSKGWDLEALLAWSFSPVAQFRSIVIEKRLNNSFMKRYIAFYFYSCNHPLNLPVGGGHLLVYL